ncbi:hypothetical protein D9M70_624630 [compost metagenome]
MQAGTFLVFDRLQCEQRIEAVIGNDHAGAVCHTGQIAQNHAEAVIERNRNTKPVLLTEPHRLANEETIIENIVMSERRPFGATCGATGELDINRIVKLQLVCKL